MSPFANRPALSRTALHYRVLSLLRPRMPLYEYQCESCANGSSGSRNTPIRRSRRVRPAGQSEEAAVVAGDSVQGLRLLHHRLREEDRRASTGKSPARQVADRRTSEWQVGEHRRPPATAASSSSTPAATTTSTTTRAQSRPERISVSGRARLGRVHDAQIRAEVVGEVRTPQREVDDRLQESQLVAGVVANAVDAAAVDRRGSSAGAEGRW